TLIVTAQRDADFAGPIAISTAGLPANVTATSQSIDAGATEARLEIKLNEQAALGTYAFTILGRSKVGDRSVMATLLPPSLTVIRPFALKIEPNPVAVSQGEIAR